MVETGLLKTELLLELALEIAKLAQVALSQGKSLKRSRAVQKSAKQMFRAKRDGKAISGEEFRLAKELAARYEIDEIEEFLKSWRACRSSRADSESAEMRAVRMTICCCDVLRAMKRLNAGRLHGNLQREWVRYSC